MKIRNIVFSGFMASILMAGGAYAEEVTVPTLATKGYADSIATYAKDLVTAETSARTTADSGLSTSLNEHTTNTTVHITADERTKWNGAVSGLATEVTDRTTADTTITNFIGAIPTGSTAETIVGYIDEKVTAASTGASTSLNALSQTVEGISSDLDVAEENISALQGLVGNEDAGLVKDVATLQSEVETTTTGLLARMNVVEGEDAGSIAKAQADAEAYATAAVAALQGNTDATVEDIEDAIAAINGCTGDYCYMTSGGPVAFLMTGDTYDRPTD